MNTQNNKCVKQKRYSQKNIINLKKLIFPPISDCKLPYLNIDEESIKYITFHNSAQEITNIIMNNLMDFPPVKPDAHVSWNNKTQSDKMKKLVITEMTAGVGGNVLNFAKYFKYVNAIEINVNRYRYLVKNIKLYNYENVNCYNDNSVHLLVDDDNLNQDIIFFDPPWGGKDYKSHVNLLLNFEGKSIEEICNNLLQRPQNKMLVLKLPNNYDFNFFKTNLCKYNISIFALERITIVVVKNYPVY